MQYRLPPLQNQHALHNMLSPVNRGNALHSVSPDVAPGMAPRNYTLPPSSFLGSAYPAVTGVQYPLAYPGGMMNNRPLSGPPSPLPPAAANSHLAASSSVTTGSGGQLQGCFLLVSMFLLFFLVYSFLCYPIIKHVL